MKKIVIWLLCGVLSVIGITILTSGPSEAASAHYITGSKYGQKIYYDTDYRNGYQWKRLKSGQKVKWNKNLTFKTSGKSFALIFGLDGVQCYTYNGPFRLSELSGNPIMQGYSDTRCMKK